MFEQYHNKRWFIGDYFLFDNEFIEDDNVIIPDPKTIQQQLDFIKKLTPQQIVDVKIFNEYTDDHIPSVDASVYFNDGTVLTANFIWVGNIGMFKYWKCDDAKNDLITYLKSFL